MAARIADSTPFEGGVYKVKLTLPTDYPHAPPKGARARALCCRGAASAVLLPLLRRLCISASSVTPPMGDVKSFSPGQVAKRMR